MPPRRRASIACRLCKSQKVKCSATFPTCSKCAQRGVTCVYTKLRRTTRSSVSSQVPGFQSLHTERVLDAATPKGERILLPPTLATDALAMAIPRHENVSPLSAVDQEPLDTAVELSSQCKDCLRTFPPSSSHLVTTNSDCEIRCSQAGASHAQPSGKVNHLLVLLLESFFREEYPLPSYSFVHPTSTIAKCHAGTLEPCLSLALAGVATLHISMRLKTAVYTRNNSAFTDNEDEATMHSLNCTCRGLAPIRAAEQIIWSSIETPTVAKLQALLLCINHGMQTGRFQRAFMLAAMAARFATALRLHRENPSLDFVARETRRRIVWSLKLIERYFSIGLPEFELCPFETIFIQLPCTESMYDVGIECPSETSNPSSPLEDDRGAYRLCVNLETLRRDIVKLGRDFAVCGQISPQFPSLIGSFERALSEIGARLPHGPELSFDQINTLVASQWLPRHIALQLSWHQCHCDLYRLLLQGYPEAGPQHGLEVFLQQASNDDNENGCEDILLRAERHCLQHANAIIMILTMLNQQSTRVFGLEFDTTICAYHATRLLLFISRFGKDLKNRPSEEFTLSRLDLSLAALRRFFPQNELVGPIITEMEDNRRKFAARTYRAPLSVPWAVRRGNTVIAQDFDAQAGPSDVPSAPTNTVPPLASKTTEVLAVHSLLRQARFSDKENADRGTSIPIAGTPPTNQPNNILSQTDPPGFNGISSSQTEFVPENFPSSSATAKQKMTTVGDALSGQPTLTQDTSTDALTDPTSMAPDNGTAIMGEDWDFASFMPLQAWVMPNLGSSWPDLLDTSWL
ncbi:uncharacterized protein N7496_010588 [Penicillium cataractarum]|uniref:Zn(2)-C6 fungal-type domain-containing protein n=1 Tax=Penicillium cataractarum TaxID=2100454 RepID=A0A9W9RSK6_9EURO|nr:uncharacterized protein N7496_010588 [Penicillium cataractarum]KAJ5364875.1 hypothetical protein N7496_010588 [Penicillium cataractarum]